MKEEETIKITNVDEIFEEIVRDFWLRNKPIVRTVWLASTEEGR